MCLNYLSYLKRLLLKSYFVCWLCRFKPEVWVTIGRGLDLTAKENMTKTTTVFFRFLQIPEYIKEMQSTRYLCRLQVGQLFVQS